MSPRLRAVIDARFGRLLARAAADRNDADHDAAATFTADDAKEALDRTAELLAEVERLVTPG